MQLSKLVSKIFHGAIILSFLALLLPLKAKAATLSLDPATASVAPDATFTINVNLDTKGEKTTATDVVLTFDPSMLEIANVSFPSPPLYPTNTKVLDNTNGKIRMTSTQEEAVSSYQGEGTLSTLTIKAKAVGNAAITFACETGKTNESNVFKKGTSQDILECGNLINGNYTISTSGTSGATVTPTRRPTLPTSGNIGPTGTFIIGGAVLLGIGALLIFLF